MLSAQAPEKGPGPEGISSTVRASAFCLTARMPDTWSQAGKTMEVSGEGMVLTKTSGGDFPIHVACGEVLSSGVHTWEVVINSGAGTNGNRDMKIGVAKQGCNLEKGDHHNKDAAWYLPTHDACL